MTKEVRNKAIAIRLSEEMLLALKAEAEENGRTTAGHVIHILKHYLHFTEVKNENI